MLVEAAPLVPDRTICNPINDFKLGGIALTDTSLSFVVSDMLNPAQQNALNASLTPVAFIHRERKAALISSAAWRGGKEQLPSVHNYSQISCGFMTNNC